MPIKPILTGDGLAIQMKDGWPLVELEDGQRVPWDLERQRTSLQTANDESKTRRLLIEKIAKGLGVDEKSIEATVAEIPGRLERLEELERMAANGQLDEDAEAKIKALAEKRAKDEVEALNAKVTTTARERDELRAQNQRNLAELTSTKRQQALIEFYRGHDRFREDALPGFLRAASAPDAEGYQWLPTEQKDANGVPRLALMKIGADGKPEDVRKSADGTESLALKDWADRELSKSDPYLFKSANGTGVGEFGKLGAKSLGEMTKAETRERARAELGRT